MSKGIQGVHLQMSEEKKKEKGLLLFLRVLDKKSSTATLLEMISFVKTVSTTCLSDRRQKRISKYPDWMIGQKINQLYPPSQMLLMQYI